MHAKKYLLGALAALPLFMQTVHAQTAGAETPPEAPAHVESAPAEGPVDQPDPETSSERPITAPGPVWSDTGDIAESDFPDIYRKIMSDVPEPQDIDGWIEHARILMAGGLFRESAGAVERAVALAPESGIDGAGSGRLRELASALRLMGAEPEAEGIGDDGTAEGSDGYFMRLDLLQSRQNPKSAEVLAVASGLSRQSPPVIRRSIPILIDAARRSGDVEATRALHGISMDTPGVKGTALGHFIGAELLRMEKKPQAAFVEYGMAAALHGEYAIRARLRIAELVLDEPGQKRDALVNLQGLVATGLDEWRGNRLTLLLLTRYAEVSERLGDAPSALRAMARILIEFPEEPQADLARGRSVRILAQQADDLTGDIEKLAQTVRLFRELEPAMADLPGWGRARTMLAQKLVDAGLHEMARAEYAAILASSGGNNPDNSRQDRVIALHGLIGLFGQADRPELGKLVKEFRSDILENPGLLSATLRASGPAEFALLNVNAQENPYFTGDDHAQIGRIRFEGGNMNAALAAWDKHLGDGKTLSKEMRSRYYHAKSVVQKGLGYEGVSASDGEPDHLEGLLSASLKRAPDLALFDGRTSLQMLDDAAALVELVKTETASADDAKNDKTED